MKKLFTEEYNRELLETFTAFLVQGLMVVAVTVLRDAMKQSKVRNVPSNYTDGFEDIMGESNFPNDRSRPKDSNIPPEE